MKGKLSRRSFMNMAGALGLYPGVSALAGEKQKIRNFNKSMVYRPMGKTGEQISVYSVGTGNCRGNVLAASMKLGVNFYHTCVKYLNGESIKILSKVIKGKRDNLHIALKGNSQEKLEKGLKILDTKWIDFLMFKCHDTEKFKEWMPEIRKNFLTWKEKGLVRYAGLTIHGQHAAMMDAALKQDIFSCLMPGYSPVMEPQLVKQVQAANKKGVAIIAMKTKGELDAEAYCGRIKKLLSDNKLATINKAATALSDLNDWARAATQTDTGFFSRQKKLDMASADYHGCGLCGQCEGACPNGVKNADIVRCIRYYNDAEGSPEMARHEFRNMGLQNNIIKCIQCGTCEGICPQEINIRQEIRRAAAYLG